MVIGIDLLPLQGPHRYRGIGSVVRNFINRLPPEARKEHRFVFFVQPDPQTKQDALNILRLDGLDYEVRLINHQKKINQHLPGKLNLIINTLNRLALLWEYRMGDSRISKKLLSDIDVYMQFDPTTPLPKGRGLKKVLFVHDLIPYVLEWDYLWNYQTARRHNYSRRGALKAQTKRWLYKHGYRLTTGAADKIIAISQTTKNDMMTYLHIPESKIHVAVLGTTNRLGGSNGNASPPSIIYQPTSWGYLPKQTKFIGNIPFVFYAGGADARRKIEDLVTAFNRLRAQGIDLRLVLAGDSMASPMNISTQTIRNALLSSSFLDDIIFLGYTDDSSLEWLYQNALAFVFPTRYEGFGLPVIEAMAQGCPVICYDNPATREVADNAVIYARNAEDIEASISELMFSRSPEKQNRLIKKAINHSKIYDWRKTSKDILEVITKT